MNRFDIVTNPGSLSILFDEPSIRIYTITNKQNITKKMTSDIADL